VRGSGDSTPPTCNSARERRTARQVVHATPHPRHWLRLQRPTRLGLCGLETSVGPWQRMT
jgi:hypothetical protein